MNCWCCGKELMTGDSPNTSMCRQCFELNGTLDITQHAQDCEHGRLARTCEVCELKRELAEMTKIMKGWATAAGEAKAEAMRERERAEKAEAQLAEYEGAYEQTLSEVCGDPRDDRDHCPCVPFLRKAVERLTTERDVARSREREATDKCKLERDCANSFRRERDAVRLALKEAIAYASIYAPRVLMREWRAALGDGEGGK